MNCKLFASELLCAALLLGCSSAPKLSLPSGDWVEVNQPGATLPLNATSPTPLSPYPRPAPAVTVSTPRAPIVFGAPPVNPVVPGSTATTVPVAPSPVPGVAAATPPKVIAPGPMPATGKAPSPAPVTPPKTVAAPTVAPTKVFPGSPAPPVAAVSAARPTPIPPPLPTWTAPVGSTLHQTVADWCKRAGVQLIWNQEDLDYPIEAPLNFKGTFAEAIAQIFPLYDGAKRSFVVDGNTSSQGILFVSERKK